MKTQNKLFMILLALAFVISACGGSPTEVMEKPTEEVMMEKPTEETMMEKPTEEAMMSKETPTPDAMAKPEDAMMEAPAWYSVSLTNVQSGETFTVSDLKGKVILVETMAVWCPNCKRQQEQVKALHELLGERDDFVSLGIDIDPNEDAAKLKEFTEANGFDWTYVVAPADVSSDISSLYGAQFLNPPSTPMLIIDRKGKAHPLPFGIKSADELLEALQPFLDEAM